MSHSLALLRGINVGGRNKVPMADLRAAFADLGAEDVQTYIASGNVLFASGVDAAALEAGLTERFGFELKVVVLTAAQMRKLVAGAPDGFGWDDHRCDVVFLRPPLTARRAGALLNPREGIDHFWLGPRCVYFARLAARASGSRFGLITQVPEYQDMTIRSWTTISRLAVLMRERTA